MAESRCSAELKPAGIDRKKRPAYGPLLAKWTMSLARGTSRRAASGERTRAFFGNNKGEKMMKMKIVLMAALVGVVGLDQAGGARAGDGAMAHGKRGAAAAERKKEATPLGGAVIVRSPRTSPNNLGSNTKGPPLGANVPSATGFKPGGFTVAR